MAFVEVHPERSVTQNCALYRLLSEMHTETNITCTWKTINLVKDALLSAQNLLVFQGKEFTSAKHCGLAHSKVQDWVLKDVLKLGVATTKAQWGTTT
eukprot:g37749.t1